MNFVTFGDNTKDAIIFLHGWGGNESSFSYFAKALSNEHFCVVVEFNSTFHQPKVVNLEDFANDLYGVLNKLNISSASFVCHSFGGRVFAKFYEKFDFDVKKVVLTSVAGLPKRKNLWYYLNRIRFKFCKFLSKLGLYKTKRLEKFYSSDYLALNVIEKKSFSNIISENLEPLYAKITCETLLFWGEKDTETPLYMAKRLKAIIKNSALIVCENFGHFCYVECSFKFIAVLRRFFSD